MKKTYSELISYSTFEDRLEYLRIGGSVGADTFGHLRYLNQQFYRSKEWRDLRDWIIIRDNGCDMALEGLDVYGRIYIHHIDPVLPKDLLSFNPSKLLSPDNLVCVSYDTHAMIHYGIKGKSPEVFSERKPGDTCPWKQGDF